MKITREFLEKVLKLRNVRDCGDNFMASCPFESQHSDGKDSNPSFGIHKESGLWYCFACGEKGSLVSLVSCILGKSTRVATEVIEGYFSRGVDVEKLEKKIRSFEEMLNGSNKEENVDSECLLPQGYTKDLPVDVLNFFNCRGISKEVLEKFEVGFCREGKYKNMIIFPIFLGGSLNGFIARVIGEDIVEKKYQFPKNLKKALYNLFPIRGLIYLVEGPLDALKLYTLGLKNACALLGSSISYFQIRLLIKHKVKEVIIMLDGDETGRKASNIVAKMIKPFFLRVSILNLPDGMDPCDISGRVELKKLLKNVVDFEYNK